MTTLAERDTAARVKKLYDALLELTAACEADAGKPGPNDEDDEPVGWQGGSGADGVEEQAKPMALTFGMMRRARAALAS